MATTLINRKCAGCGLVNFAAAPKCKRCHADLDVDEGGRGAALKPEAFDAPAEGADPSEEVEAPRRGLASRVARILTVTCAVVVAWHVSLLLTSDAASMNQRLQVRGALDAIERGGFAREAFLLKRLASFRTSDNWWNGAVGHGEAYAATNFPFEVVTLYPEFFKYPADDTERAVILLHEARHLSGAGEHDAFASVWRDKARLGWTREKYSQTRVWKNVGEFTRRYAPELFTCGKDGQQDCVE
jgi:hypothetical protein